MKEWSPRYINLHTRHPNVNYETVGYFTRGTNNSMIRFFHTGKSSINPVNGRRFVQFPHQKSTLLWHTHSPKDGFWPSIEDLRWGGLIQRGQSNKKSTIVNVLFTQYGVWIYKGFISSSSARGKQFPSLLEPVWYAFHRDMELLTQEKPHWNVHRVRRRIRRFLYTMNTKLSYHIQFVPRFFQHEQSFDDYIRIVNQQLLLLV